MLVFTSFSPFQILLVPVFPFSFCFADIFSFLNSSSYILPFHPLHSLFCCFVLSLKLDVVVVLLLIQGGDMVSMTDTHMPRLYLLQWLKSDRALLMLFNDGTFQVNTLTT